MTSVHGSLDVIPPAQISPTVTFTKGVAHDSDSADERESYSESDDAGDAVQDRGVGLAVMKREVETILRKVFSRYDSFMRQQLNTRVVDGTGSEQQYGRPSASSGTSGNQDGNFHSASAVSTGKRPLVGDDADEGVIIASKKPRIIHKPGKVLFACPFWKQDPLRHSRCYKLELKEVKRVKQHLYRSHKKPIRCRRCQSVFPNRAACDSHQAVDCVRQPEIIDDGINEDQASELSNRGSSSLTQEQRWFVMWQIVLPGVPEPASPYIDDDLSEDMCEFREFYQRHGSAILLDHIRTTPSWSQEDEDRVRDAFWAEILDLALDNLYHRWLAQRAQARRSSSQATIQLATDQPPGTEPAIDLSLDSPTSPPGSGGLRDAAGPGGADGFSFVGDPAASGSYDSAGDWLYSAWQSENARQGV